MPSTGPAQASTWTARRVRASGSSVLLALATIVALFLARELFVAASQPVGWLAAAATVALVLHPVIEVQARRIPRGIAIASTLLLLVVGAVGLGAGLVLEVQEQLEQLRERLPAAAAEIEEGSDPDGFLVEMEFASLVDDLVDQASERIAPEPTIEDTVGTVPAFLVSGILVVFLLIWGDDILRGLRQQIADEERRERLSWIAASAARLTQQYVVAAFGIGVAVAVVGGLLAWALDLQTPLVLGVLLGGAALVPYVGVLAGSVPLLLLTAASHPAPETVLVGVALVALQAAATLVTRQVVERRTLRVGPAVLLVAVVIGSDVYGFGGALVSVVAAVLAVAAVESWERSASEARTRGATSVA